MAAEEKDCDELHGWYSPTQFNKNNETTWCSNKERVS